MNIVDCCCQCGRDAPLAPKESLAFFAFAALIVVLWMLFLWRMDKRPK